MPFIYQYFGTSKKHNPDATTDPTANDDSATGYSIDSHWTNTATNEAFVCVDNTTGAAVWRRTTDITLDGGTLAGRYTGAGTGVIQQIALGNNITMTTGGVLNVSSGTATLGDGDYGDVTVSGTGSVITIDADIVDNVKAANMAEGTFKGRASIGTGNPEDLSAAQALTILGVEAGATADQTGAEIKTAYEAEPDTNPFDDAAAAKLAGITPLADVTNATTVAAAGAVMEADTSTALMQFVLDEDSMSSNSATKLATQQSIVAYVTAQISAALASSMTFKGSYNAATNTPDLDTSPTGVITGDTYVVTVAGTFFTTAVEVGDTLIAEIDSADAESEWTIVQANLTAATIKTSYESNADTNAFTDTEQAKLAGIEALADVTDATNVNAAGAVMESDYNAQTILAATLDNTPAPLTVGEAQFVGRATGGNVASLNATQARTILNVADGAQVNPANMLDADVTTGTDTTPKTSNAAQLKLAAQTWGGGSSLSLAASTLAGRGSAAGTGAPVQIALGTNLSMSGTTLNASGGSSSGLTAVATLAALKALTKASLTTGDVRLIRSYSVDGDGGHGIWRYNSASSTTANEGTVVATNEGGTGRWFRLYSGAVNVRWFGAKGDGTTDDTAAIQAAINFQGTVVNGVPGVTVDVPPGNYRITATITISRKALWLRGYGLGNTPAYSTPGTATHFFWGGAAAIPMFSVDDVRNLCISDMCILGNGTNKPSAGIRFVNAGGSSGTNERFYVKNVRFGTYPWSSVTHSGTTKFLATGIVCDGTNANNDQFAFEDCEFADCDYGIHLPNAQSIWGRITGCQFLQCTNGIRALASLTCYDLQFWNCTVDVFLGSTARVSVDGWWCENSFQIFDVTEYASLTVVHGRWTIQTEMQGAAYFANATGISENLSITDVAVVYQITPHPPLRVRGVWNTPYVITVRNCAGLSAIADLDIQGHSVIGTTYVDIDTGGIQMQKSITNTGLGAAVRRVDVGTLAVTNSLTASAVGTLSRKIEVFDASGTSLGFIPVYTTIT